MPSDGVTHRARCLLDAFLEQHQQPSQLDTPIVEYLCSVITQASRPASEDDIAALSDTLQSCLEGSSQAEIEQSARSLLSDYQSGKTLPLVREDACGCAPVGLVGAQSLGQSAGQSLDLAEGNEGDVELGQGVGSPHEELGQAVGQAGEGEVSWTSRRQSGGELCLSEGKAGDAQDGQLEGEGGNVLACAGTRVSGSSKPSEGVLVGVSSAGTHVSECPKPPPGKHVGLGSAADSPKPPQRKCLGSAAESKLAGGVAGLRVWAAEFVPLTASKPTPATLRAAPPHAAPSVGPTSSEVAAVEGDWAGTSTPWGLEGDAAGISALWGMEGDGAGRSVEWGLEGGYECGAGADDAWHVGGEGMQEEYDGGCGGSIRGGDEACQAGWSDGCSEEWPEVNSPGQAVELLQLWFPSFSQDALWQLYQACAQDLRICFQELISIEGEEDSRPSPSASTGSCAAAAPTFTSASQPKHHPVLDFNKMDAFPCLGGSGAATREGSSGMASSGQSGVASSSGRFLSPDVSWSQVIKKKAAPQISTGRRHPSSSSWSQSKTSGQHGGASQGPHQADRQGGSLPNSVPWVSTGAAVSAEYSDARKLASGHARARNQYCQQATIAYLSGNKALAKELSRQGREHAEAMWQAHAAASQLIFRSRNSHLVSGASTHFLDLHGLHVTEACDVVANILGLMRAQAHAHQAVKPLHICVGTGHHSKPGASATRSAPARLSAAVTQLLRSEGARFRVVTPGLLEVVL